MKSTCRRLEEKINLDDFWLNLWVHLSPLWGWTDLYTPSFFFNSMRFNFPSAWVFANGCFLCSSLGTFTQNASCVFRATADRQFHCGICYSALCLRYIIWGTGCSNSQMIKKNRNIKPTLLALYERVGIYFSSREQRITGKIQPPSCKLNSK